MDSQITSKSILSKALQSLKENFIFFLALSMLFMLVSGLLLYLIGDSLITNNLFLIVFWLLVVTAIYTRFAVMIHRAVLLKERNLLNYFSWSFTDTRFFLFAVQLMIAFSMIVFLFAFLTSFIEKKSLGGFYIVFIAIMFFAAYVLSRIALVFPAAALKHETFSFHQAWKSSEPFKGMLFGLVIVVPFVFNKLLDLIEFGGLLSELIWGVFTLILTIYEITLLSHAYQDIVLQDMSSEEE